MPTINTSVIDVSPVVNSVTISVSAVVNIAATVINASPVVNSGTISVGTVLTAGIHAFMDGDDSGDYADDLSADIQAASWSLGIKEAFQTMADEAQATLTLDNTDGKYNPENTGGTFYPNLVPHKKLRIYLSDGTTQYLMWSGFVESYDPEWRPLAAYSGKSTCQLIGKGIKQQLEQVTFQGQIYSNITGDAVVNDALAQVVLPPTEYAGSGWLLGIAGRSELGTTTILGEEADYSTVDTGLTTFSSFGGNADYNCYSAIRAITEAERGRFFQDRHGRAIWWNRHHLLLNATVTATVADSVGATYPPKKVDYDPHGAISNVIRVTATPREETSDVTLWRLNTAVSILPLTTTEFEADYNDAYLNATGAGSDVSLANETYSTGSATAEIFENRGNRAVIRVRNNTSSLAVLDTLSIVGTAITDKNIQTAELMDADSILAYGKKERRFSLKALDSLAQAQTIARFELNRRKDPHAIVRSLGWIHAMNSAHAQIAWTMGTRLTVQLANGHDADHFVIGEAHRWQRGMNGGVHETSLYLEPAGANNFWVLGKAGQSELGETTILGY